MLTNRMTAVLVATFALSLSASNADAQVLNSPFYPSTGVRNSPAGWNRVPGAVNTIGTRTHHAPRNHGCANGVCGSPAVVGSPFYGGNSHRAYGRRMQPGYNGVPHYRPIVTYPSRGFAVPANLYRTPVQNGYERPVIIKRGVPVGGGLPTPSPLNAPIPIRTNGPMSSPFYP